MDGHGDFQHASGSRGYQVTMPSTSNSRGGGVLNLVALLVTFDPTQQRRTTPLLCQLARAAGRTGHNSAR